MVDVDVSSSESCFLTLNYAYYHVIGCTGLLMFCYLSNTSTKYFKAANNFGVFAILSDYGLMYLTRNLRTISVVQETDSDDVDQLHGIGTFLFFLWFDWLGAFALIIWARTVADVVKVGKIPNLNTCLVVFQQIAMWWSAPILSQHMQLDDRKLVLTRASPKFTYFVMLLSFTYLLFKSCEIKTREYLSIVIAGIAAASLHHAALFVNNMRGYDSIYSLALTMCTEWPALLCGEAYFRKSFPKTRHNKNFRNFMLIILLSMMAPHFPTDLQATEFLISVIPGHHMQKFGTAMLRFKTCTLPSYLPETMRSDLTCMKKDVDDIWIITTPAKSGAVLSAKILLSIALECNFCLASGTRDSAGIPGPGTHVPTYKGNVLHAIMNMDEWPSYVEQHSSTNSFKCVVITRDPLNRLKSFYTYARSGGEHWLRYESDIMTSLRTAENLEESVQIFWDRVGKEYLLSSHTAYMNDSSLGCSEIKFEDLSNDFGSGIGRLLDIFEVNESARGHLVKKLMLHDRSKVSEAELVKDIHVSSMKFSIEFKSELERVMMEEIEELGETISRMRAEMKSTFK